MDTVSLAVTAIENEVQDMLMQDPQLSSMAQNPDPSPSEFTLPPPVVNLGRIWFTKARGAKEQPRYLLPSSIATTSPLPQQDDLTHVDDQYRQRLSKVFLRPVPQDDPLPSSDFLVCWLISASPYITQCTNRTSRISV